MDTEFLGLNIILAVFYQLLDDHLILNEIRILWMVYYLQFYKDLYTNSLFAILHEDIHTWTQKILVIYDISNFLLTFGFILLFFFLELYIHFIGIIQGIIYGILQTNTLYINFYDKELTILTFTN